MSLPRIARISRSDICSKSLPAKRMLPAILPGGSGISRISDIEVTDLPQPDSPTIASVSPSSTWKDTPLTARLMPLGVRKWVWRFSTSSSAIVISPLTSEALGHARIERIAKAVAEQVHGKHGDGQEGRRKGHDVGLDLPQRAAFGHAEDIGEPIHHVKIESYMVRVDGHSNYGHAFELWHERHIREVTNKTS